MYWTKDSAKKENPAIQLCSISGVAIPHSKWAAYIG